jgi:hypothetical protein
VTSGGLLSRDGKKRFHAKASWRADGIVGETYGVLIDDQLITGANQTCSMPRAGRAGKGGFGCRRIVVRERLSLCDDGVDRRVGSEDVCGGLMVVFRTRGSVTTGAGGQIQGPEARPATNFGPSRASSPRSVMRNASPPLKKQAGRAGQAPEGHAGEEAHQRV